MGTRKECREALAGLFTGQGFTAVYDYAPLDLKGANKVLVIYANRTRHDVISQHFNNNFYTLFLDVYVKRVNGSNAEDELDDLHETVRSVIRANIVNPTWNELDLDENSEALFAQVAGVPYRLERHTLTIKVSTS